MGDVGLWRSIHGHFCEGGEKTQRCFQAHRIQARHHHVLSGPRSETREVKSALRIPSVVSCIVSKGSKFGVEVSQAAEPAGGSCIQVEFVHKGTWSVSPAARRWMGASNCPDVFSSGRCGD